MKDKKRKAVRVMDTDRTAIAEAMLENYELTYMQQCLVLNEMLGKNQRYKDLNEFYDNPEDFINDHLKISSTQAYRMSQIGGFISGVVSENTIDDLLRNSPRGELSAQARGQKLLAGGDPDEQDRISVISKLGITKMREISSHMETEQFKIFVKNNKTIIPDGSRITVDELLEMNTREVSARFSKKDREKNREIAALKAKNKEIKADLKLAETEKETLQAQFKPYKNFEEEYKDLDPETREKMVCLQRALKAQAEFFRAMNTAKVDAEDNKAVTGLLASLVRNYETYWEDKKGEYEYIISQADMVI